MDSPKQVAARVENGWVMKGHPPVTRPPWKFPHIKSDEPLSGLAGLRTRWEQGNHWHPQYQYVTQGPEIRAWQIENNVVTPWGEWWRPDVWQYRIRLSVAADAGLKEITIYDGDRGVFRRFQPNGAKTFEHTMVLTNTQQRDLVPIVEDMNGKRAIGMSLFNRNTMLDQFICGDRCNFLGRSMSRTRDNRPVYTPPGFRPNLGISPSKGEMDLLVQPDISTTLDTPTLPIDGRPIGAPKFSLQFKPGIPGELKRPFSLPTVYMIGPDMGIGQGTYKLGYDPAEMGAEETPLGHPYDDPEKQGHVGRNAWTSWYRLVPLKKVNGWARIHVAGWLPEEVRYGWFELYWTMIDDAELAPEGIQLGYFNGECEVYRNGELVASPDQDNSSGPFSRGTIAVVPTGLIIAMDDQLQFEHTSKGIRFFYRPQDRALAQGDEIHLKIGFGGVATGTPKEKIMAFADQFGISTPGKQAYNPKIAAGKELDTYFTWTLDGGEQGIRAQLPRTRMHGHLTTIVEKMNDNWSVQLVDYNRDWPNHRALPHRDGRAYAQLDLNLADSDVFIGHPVVADNSNIKLLVSWMEPGKWFVEAHNPGPKTIETTLHNPATWEIFDFNETVQLPPGSSQTWEVATSGSE